MEELFINRDENFNQFDISLEESVLADVPYIFFVLGISGIGKSFFSKEILKRYNNYAGIKVSIPKTNDTPEGYYIEKIAQCIDSLAHLYGYPSFLSFFIKQNDPKRKEKYLCSLKDIILDEHIVGKLIKATEDFLISDDQESVKRKLFNSRTTEAQDLHREYIKYIIKNNQIILNIENVQNIDIVSLDYISELILELHHNVFIFEYTTTERLDERKGEFEIYSTFQSLFDISDERLFIAISFLKKLSKDDFHQIISEYGIPEAFNVLYSNYDGDLRCLRHFQITYKKDKKVLRKTNKYINYRQFHLEHINKNSLFLLILIAVHKGVLPYEQLYYIYEHNKTQAIVIDIDEEIRGLEQNEDLIIINQESNTIFIKHDSTSDTLLNEKKFIKIRNIAFNTWISYYENILLKNSYVKITEEYALTMLFYLYFNHSPHRLYELLSRIKKYIFSNVIYPFSARSFIYPLFANLPVESKNYQKNIFEIINLFYSLSMYDDAYNVLNKSVFKNEKYIVFKAAILNRKNDHERALTFIEDCLTNSSSLKLNLILKIIKLVSLRSLNRFGEMLDCYNNIIEKEKEYKDLMEYGFFLRISQVCLAPEDAIKNIKTSIKYFKNNMIEKANSEVTLSLYYIRSGNLDKALALLNSASVELSSRITERHVIKNNMAVVLLYKNCITEEVQQLLLDARVTGIGNFNKIVIHNNLLIYYSLIGDQEQSLMCIEVIEKLLKKEPDKALHRTAYYNISFFYDSIKETELSNRYLQKTIDVHKDISNSIDSFWETKLGITKSYNGFFKFLTKNRFYLPTISNWGITIDLS